MTKIKYAALAACALSATAYAQPDVQLYGKVDMAIQYTKNPGKSAVVNLQNETSRWGLLIREDLNADWAVKAYLEAGFNANDGSEATKGVVFNRRSILAVYNKTIGEIGVGRMGTVQSISSPYGIGLPNLDPFMTGYGPAYEIEGSFGGDGRVNNAITWLSNKMKGFQIGVSYSLGVESDESIVPKNDRSISVAATYGVGPILFVAGGSQFRWGKIPASDLSADMSSSEAAKATNRKNSEEVFGGFRWKVTDHTTAYLAAQYMRNWRTFAYWRPANSTTKKPEAGNPHGLNAVSFLTGFRHKFTGNLTWIGAAGYLDGSMKTPEGKKQDGERMRFATALEYTLSKRTMVYANIAYARNFGQLVNYSHGKNLYTGLVGLQHKF